MLHSAGSVPGVISEGFVEMEGSDASGTGTPQPRKHMLPQLHAAVPKLSSPLSSASARDQLLSGEKNSDQYRGCFLGKTFPACDSSRRR